MKTDVVADSNDEGPHRNEGPHRIVRPSLEEFSDACFAAESFAPQPLPVKLRPIVKTKSCELDLHHTTSEENIVVYLNKLSDLVTSFQHNCSDPSANVKMEGRNICTYYQFMFSFQ